MSEPKPTTYTLLPTQDDGFVRVEGLKRPGSSYDVVIPVPVDATDVEMVNEILGQFRKSFKEGDIFITNTGNHKYTGEMLIPWDKPITPPVVEEREESLPNAVTAPTAPAVNPNNLPIQVPVSAVDSKGAHFGGILDLPWPNVTNSEIVAKWDEVSKALSPGNLLTTIKVPGSDQRILEVGYNADVTRVMLQVG